MFAENVTTPTVRKTDTGLLIGGYCYLGFAGLYN